MGWNTLAGVGLGVLALTGAYLTRLFVVLRLHRRGIRPWKPSGFGRSVFGPLAFVAALSVGSFAAYVATEDDLLLSWAVWSAVIGALFAPLALVVWRALTGEVAA